MSTEGFWRGASAIFWVFFAIFILIMITITWVQFQRPSLSQDYQLQCQYNTLKAVVNALDIFSTLMFWYLFLTTGYWFVFFKI